MPPVLDTYTIINCNSLHLRVTIILDLIKVKLGNIYSANQPVCVTVQFFSRPHLSAFFIKRKRSSTTVVSVRIGPDATAVKEKGNEH
jgi:hypothetical protein